jgi:hypothetical protein
MAKAEFPYNNHHSYFFKKHYKHPKQKALRVHWLAQAALYIPIHQDLHAANRGIAPPTHTLLIGALDTLDSIERKGSNTPVDTAQRLADYFGRIGSDITNQVHREALSHQEHIAMQIPYLIEGGAHYCH